MEIYIFVKYSILNHPTPLIKWKAVLDAISGLSVLNKIELKIMFAIQK